MIGRFGQGRRAIDYFVELSLFLFVSTGFVTAAATGKLDTPTVLLVAGALGLRSLAFLGLSRFSLSPSTVTRLTAGYFFFYLFDYFFISHAFVDATAHLVFFVLVMKVFSARVNRDYLYLVLLAFMQMLLAAILTIDTSFFVFFLVFLVFGIATFTSYEIRRSYLRASSPVEVEGTLMMRGLGLTSVFVSLGILLVAGLIFFAIPRISTGYLSRFAPKTQNIAGFSDDVTLGELGEIKKTTLVVMRVRFRTEPPRLTQLRYRGVALTSFDGHRWHNTHGSTIIIPGWNYAVAGASGSVALAQPGMLTFTLRRADYAARRRWLSYTVLLEPISAEHLFLIPVAQNVMGRFRWLEKDANDSIILRDRTAAAMRYDAWSDIATPDLEQVRKDTGPYPDQVDGNPLAIYLQLPRLDPRIAALARQVTQGATNAYDRARLLEEHLRGNYGYTLDMPLTGEDPLAGFLFTQKRGHCEYFASAMTVMLRTLGIAARIVNGFLPGEYNDISGMYVIRASDAHSWVEAYFPSHGWITFDPTPASGTAGSGFLRLSMWLDALQTFWLDWVVNYDFTRQSTLARSLDRTSRRATAQTQDYLRGIYQAMVGRLRSLHRRLIHDPALAALVLLVAALGLGAGLFGQPLLELLRRNAALVRSRTGRATSRDATLAYLRLLELLARRGYRKAPGMAPREFLPHVTDPRIAPLVHQFTGIYESARFGGSLELVPQLYGLLAQVRQSPRRPRR
jgi:transglutaminase-like putative cysteine protease